MRDYLYLYSDNRDEAARHHGEEESLSGDSAVMPNILSRLESLETRLQQYHEELMRLHQIEVARDALRDKEVEARLNNATTELEKARNTFAHAISELSLKKPL